MAGEGLPVTNPPTTPCLASASGKWSLSIEGQWKAGAWRIIFPQVLFFQFIILCVNNKIVRVKKEVDLLKKSFFARFLAHNTKRKQKQSRLPFMTILSQLVGLCPPLCEQVLNPRDLVWVWVKLTEGRKVVS